MTTAYFDNIEDTIIRVLASAKDRIMVAVAWFTNQNLFNALAYALEHHVSVSIVTLDDILNRNEFGLNFGQLADNGAKIRFCKNKLSTMHNKFCVVDDKVITGSYNWTYHANQNFENILITDEMDVVDAYHKQFQALFKTAKPIPLPYSSLSWTEIQEDDFTELRRLVFRDVKSKGDSNTDIRIEKLKRLNEVYKTGDIQLLQAANAAPIYPSHTSIKDVLLKNPSVFELCLWKEAIFGYEPEQNFGHNHFRKWMFIPTKFGIDNDKDYLQGRLYPYQTHGKISLMSLSRCINIIINDSSFILKIRHYIKENDEFDGLSLPDTIPEDLLCFEYATMLYFPFDSPMYNISQGKYGRYGDPRLIPGIDVLCIAKDRKGTEFYEGWSPQERGVTIMNKYFSH